MTTFPYITSPTDEQIEKLLDVIDTGERSHPEAFVGRDDYRSTINRLVSRARLNRIGHVPGIRIIQGAPGAGKSSLLNQIAIDHSGMDNTTVALMRAGDIRSGETAFAQRILIYAKQNITKPDSETCRKINAGLSKIASLSVNWETHKPSIVDQTTEANFIWGVLHESLSTSENHVLLLLVDEAQNIAVRDGDPFNSLVESLHLGQTEPLKVVPVFAGLGTTEQVLESAGASRTVKLEAMRLNPLTEQESIEAVKGFICSDNVGLDRVFSNDSIEQIAEDIALSSEGWPRHLHNYIEGLAKQIVVDFSSKVTRKELDLDAVLKFGDEQRVLFYDNRLARASLGTFEDTLIDIAQTEPKDQPIPRSKLIDSGASNGMDPMDVEKLIEVAVHKGLLEPVGYQRARAYVFPIPSMHTFLAMNGDVIACQDVLREAYLKRKMAQYSSS